MPGYGAMEGNPVRYTDAEAWWFVDGKWRHIDSAEVAMHAHVLTQAEFEARFPNLQALPATAFQAGDN